MMLYAVLPRYRDEGSHTKKQVNGAGNKDWSQELLEVYLGTTLNNHPSQVDFVISWQLNLLQKKL